MYKVLCHYILQINTYVKLKILHSHKMISVNYCSKFTASFNIIVGHDIEICVILLHEIKLLM